MTVSLGEFASAQQQWSEKTFGPCTHRGPKGPLMHLSLEVEEALRELQKAPNGPKFLTELSDILFLLVDATWRSGYWTTDLLDEAMRKLAVNKERIWPDWKDSDANSPIEHVRT